MTIAKTIAENMTQEDLIRIIKDWDELEKTTTTGETMLRSKVEEFAGKANPCFLLIAHGFTSSCMRELLKRKEIV